MTTPSEERPARRSRGPIVMIAFALGALLAVFFVTQVLSGGRYREISEANRAAAGADR